MVVVYALVRRGLIFFIVVGATTPTTKDVLKEMKLALKRDHVLSGNGMVKVVHQEQRVASRALAVLNALHNRSRRSARGAQRLGCALRQRHEVLPVMKQQRHVVSHLIHASNAKLQKDVAGVRRLLRACPRVHYQGHAQLQQMRFVVLKTPIAALVTVSLSANGAPKLNLINK